MESRMKGKPAKSVDEYISAAPQNMQKSLRDIRKAIRTASPEAVEAISYQMPGYKYRGHPLVYFAAFKNHMSLFPASYSTVKKYRSKLKGFEISGTTIHFTPEKPLPSKLVIDIVKSRMKENEAKASEKKDGKA